jgi:hypothetical protein
MTHAIQVLNASVIRYEAGGKQFDLQTTAETTKEDYAIIKALQAVRAGDAPETFFEHFIPAFINESVLLLGHKNSMGTDEEQILLANELRKIIKGKWHFYTIEEIKIILRMGIRGDFKGKETDVVYLNIEQINSWFKKYRTERKPKAMKTTRLLEPPKEVNYQPLSFLKEGILKASNDALSDDDLTHLTGCYYERLKKAKLLPTPADKMWEIYHAERKRVENLAIGTGEAFMQDKKTAFRAYRESLTSELSLKGNYFEEKAQGNYRRHLMKLALEHFAWEETDINTLTL